VRGPLAVAVYETHARIAIEADDDGEFRQCLAVLQQLYKDDQARHTHAPLSRDAQPTLPLHAGKARPCCQQACCQPASQPTGAPARASAR
jgi:hypothetical protein